MLTVRQATEEDVYDIAQRLREADLKEIRAAGYDSPEEPLLLGLRSPDSCYVAVDNDRPLIILGTCPGPHEGLGIIWMMATDDIQKHKVRVARQTRPLVDALGARYKVLANAVHADNTLHIRWLKWAGFKILREFTFNGNRFYEFAMTTRDTNV